MKLFIDKLIDRVKEKKSHVCVGLDPHLNLLPDFLFKKYSQRKIDNQVIGEVILEFNKAIIDNVADIAVAVKPQIAFYELLGIKGFNVLKKTIKYAKDKGLLIILDAKRNDIGSTARAYAEAYFGFCDNQDNIKKYVNNDFDVDAMTINPYLGFDGIKPFLDIKSKGSFALVKTSNNSSSELQDLKLEEGQPVYQKMGGLVSKWGENYRGEYGYSNLGAVIGANYPAQLKKLREEMPHTYFLLPGYGFQGGTPQDIRYGFDQSNLGSIINSSRGIIFAYTRKPWSKKYNEVQYADAARDAVINMKNNINEVLN
ncbi:MAG: orotidine-5'-phosphate decarboxylase [bacterium]